MMIATWNVRTLIDNNNTERPSRRTALIAHELKRYNIDIAALCETRLSGEDSRIEEGEGYTFFWKGLPADVPRQHGVGFAIKSSPLSHIPETPTGISERLMTWRIPLCKGQHLSAISAYAPTLDAEEHNKELIVRQSEHSITGDTTTGQNATS